jgi:Glycosyltransferase family 87
VSSLPAAACLTIVTLAGCTHGRVAGALAEADRYLTESSDLERYLAYSNAVLGRPYHSFYVRPAGAWRDVFDSGVRQKPADFPVVSPARPLVPYRDFLVEYPPGFFLVALPPALLSRDAHAYAVAFGALMLVLLAGAVILCTRIAQHAGIGVPAATLGLWALASAVALGTVVTQRYDAAVAALLCAMCWATLARRPAVLGIAAGAAVAIKIVPALAAVMCGAYLLRERRIRDVRIAAALAVLTVVAICAPSIAGASSGLVDFVRYHRERPLEIESTAAAVLGLWHAIDPAAVAVTRSYGSSNLVGRFAGAGLTASAVAGVAGLGWVYVAAWRSFDVSRTVPGRSRALVCWTLVLLTIVIATSKVASPQYLVWLLPLGTLATLANRRWSAMTLLLISLLIAQIVYAVVLSDVEALRPWALALVLARNIGIVGWALMLAARARR